MDLDSPTDLKLKLHQVMSLLLYWVQAKSEDEIRQQITDLESVNWFFSSRKRPLLQVLFKLAVFWFWTELLFCCTVAPCDERTRGVLTLQGHLTRRSPVEQPVWKRLPSSRFSTPPQLFVAAIFGSGRARCHSNDKMTHLTFASTSQCPADESGSQPGFAALCPSTIQPAECF